MAERFIEHALELDVPHIAMLLRNDFDSAIRRQHLFQLNPMFAGKVILLNRIKWFAGHSSPSDNHAWFLWDREYEGPPIIRYAARDARVVSYRGRASRTSSRCCCRGRARKG
jgi:hypothetical protein